MRFKIDWASLIVGSKFIVFALFYFVFEGNFLSTSPQGAYIRRGNLMEGFLCYRLGGLIHGGAYFWNFTVTGLVTEVSRIELNFELGIIAHFYWPACDKTAQSEKNALSLG